MQQGFFSFALTQALGRVGSGATPRDLLRDVQMNLAAIQTSVGRNSMPEPQLEAAETFLDRPWDGSGQIAMGNAQARVLWE